MQEDAHKKIVNLVMANNEEIRCFRDKMIATTVHLMGVREDEVERFRNLKTNIKQNVKTRKEGMIYKLM